MISEPSGVPCPHIDVVFIPGPVDTPLSRYGGANVQSGSPIQFPLGRQASSWDIAYATVFMLSGEASYITGESLVVADGLGRIR
ncbi:NAD(P)-dependent dehydrogenase (short-subunit alcohol dehydrogenase family) [Mycobacterium sp. OAS707]|uniref:SDR family oxidoreductase n=1 Tax=Mycobacterium sp. OAS707 TaxID=2663822 RepID=UPI0019F0FA58|nr:SDR family oxidoreductase [Mycobacterium sp. OAS707]MBE1547359.1 NAD(P)-dependent dehydrogenase (short-subunit alcohol dehydrogenase family) [Mycobacterium sp. OAS707]